MPLSYVSDLARIWFSAQALTIGLPSIRWGIGRCAVPDISGFRVIWTKTLQELRHAHKLTQKRMAEVLGSGQDSVSRLERRSDLLISTLRGYVEAMGGRLSQIAAREVATHERGSIPVWSENGSRLKSNS
jgi:hypothetical protein